MGMIKDRNSNDLTEEEDIKKRWQEYIKELYTEVCNIVQEAVIKTISRKRNAKRQNGCLRRPYKQKRKEEK